MKKNKINSDIKILLIPPLTNPIFKKNRDKFMPLGIMSLAAILLQHNIATIIYEPKIRFLGPEDYILAAKDILNHKPTIIGFSTWCTSYPGIVLLAKEIKKINQQVIIVFGGPQASILPKETLKQYPFVDYILTGEADFTLPQLINELCKKEPDISGINGLCYRTHFNNRIILNERSAFVEDLNQLPIPSYHLIPKQKTIKLDVGRGCPYRCTYCTTSGFFSKKFRMKSVDRIVSEMMKLFNIFEVTEYEFTHDLFTLRKKEVLKICDQLLKLKQENGITLTWKCSARIDNVDEEMIIKMAKAGCTSIFFGIESGSEKIQKKIKKNLYLPQAETIADNCRTSGIDMHASYIMGFPEETKNDINLTLQNILQLLLKGALVQSSVLALLPGTPLFERHKNKLMFDGNFSNFSQTICNNEEIKLIQNNPEIFSSFYYLPVSTLNRNALVFLNKLVNKLPQFRNTCYLLGKQISKFLENADLLRLYNSEYKKIESEKLQLPVELILIKYLEGYISKKNIEKISPYIEDIFMYEGYSALLKNLYARWQLLDKDNISTLTNKSKIKPNPTWKLVSTRYKLEHVLPSENRWKREGFKCRKGVYYYLLVASSEIKCERHKVSKKEKQLLDQISEISVNKFVEKVKMVVPQKEVLVWLRKMNRLGVIEFS